MIRLFTAIALLLTAVWVSTAQPLRAPRAQALIDSLLREHDEIQTIGLHVTPPGLTENLNIAGSKPGKVGKRSAEIDLEVIRTGKPSLRMAKLGAFDIGVAIGDAKGRPLGMIVVVIPAKRALDASDAMRKVERIRDQLQARIVSLEDLFAGATVVNGPLTMVAQTPLPAMRGEAGALAVDVERDLLFAQAEESHSLEVFNLAGDYLRSEAGAAIANGLTRNPGTKVRDAASGRRYESDGTGKIHVLEAATGREVAVLDGAGMAGDINVDTAGGRLFVTGTQGIVIYRRTKDRSYQTVCRFGTMGGSRSIYVPAKRMLYIIHGKNAEDGAGLQVYEVKD